MPRNAALNHTRFDHRDHVAARSNSRLKREHAHRSGTRMAQAARFTPAEAALVLLLGIAICWVALRAVGAPELANFGTTSVRIQPSETLWGLAAEHPVPGMTTAETVDAIRELNSMEDSSVHAGQVVVVPVAESASTACASR